MCACPRRCLIKNLRALALIGALAGASALAGCGQRGDGSPDAPSLKPRACGLASFYHSSLAGNLTANGEIYRPGAMTAAHQWLPFGAKVRVTRRDTGRSVTVRINDRGPFVEGRIIDLSTAAAEKLDLIGGDGVTEVCWSRR